MLKLSMSCYVYYKWVFHLVVKSGSSRDVTLLKKEILCGNHGCQRRSAFTFDIKWASTLSNTFRFLILSLLWWETERELINEIQISVPGVVSDCGGLTKSESKTWKQLIKTTDKVWAERSNELFPPIISALYLVVSGQHESWRLAAKNMWWLFEKKQVGFHIPPTLVFHFFIFFIISAGIYTPPQPQILLNKLYLNINQIYL